ncbi:MAG: L-histidine N(alpha)-methyltransferase [Maribacter sp.]
MEHTTEITLVRTAFEKEVYAGLTAHPKYLSSKYIYDKQGDALFQEIMAMPTYYLTHCEYAILERHKTEIVSLFSRNGPFDLIELGAGDGKKTKILLRELSEQHIDFTYVPIDISENALDNLSKTITEELPDVDVEPLQGTYFETLQDVNARKNQKVILFLGSNIGNLEHEQAILFMREIQMAMQPNDLLFMGFDLKKDPNLILEAYNDKEGITAAFNKNLLVRINSELDANFELDQFLHWEVYNPESGTAKSYLVSKMQQKVWIEKLQLEISFDCWETVHTEISQKYDTAVIDWLAQEAYLTVETAYSDVKKQFINYVFKKS